MRGDWGLSSQIGIKNRSGRSGSFFLRGCAGFSNRSNAYHVGFAAGGTGGTGWQRGRFGSWHRRTQRLPDEAQVALADVASHPAEEAYFLQAGRQDVFPSKNRSVDPRSGKEMRHHVIESGLQKAVKTAVVRAGIVKRASCHTFRHSYATHLLEDGVNIRVVQDLMGHNDVKTTEIYTHVMNRDVNAVVSPLDRLDEMGNEEKSKMENGKWKMKKREVGLRQASPPSNPSLL